MHWFDHFGLSICFRKKVSRGGKDGHAGDLNRQLLMKPSGETDDDLTEVPRRCEMKLLKKEKKREH